MEEPEYAYSAAVQASLGDIVRQFEAKLFAHRQAFEAVLMAVNQIAHQDVSSEIAKMLRTLQASAVMLSDDDDEFRSHVAAELSELAQMLEDKDA